MVETRQQIIKVQVEAADIMEAADLHSQEQFKHRQPEDQVIYQAMMVVHL